MPAAPQLLLTRDASQRLGSGPAGSDAVKAHKFFKSINWRDLEARKIESKFKPIVKNTFSVENFDKIWTEQPAEDSPCRWAWCWQRSRLRPRSCGVCCSSQC